jgi:hypothetical protein
VDYLYSCITCIPEIGPELDTAQFEASVDGVLPYLWDRQIQDRRRQKGTYHAFVCLLQERLPALPLDPQLQYYGTNPLPMSAEQRKEIFYACIMDSMAARRFSISSTGLPYLDSNFERKEDSVVVPLSCSTPILLRRQGQEYVYVGHTYVDGYMHGRAVEEPNEGMLQLQPFMIN